LMQSQLQFNYNGKEEWIDRLLQLSIVGPLSKRILGPKIEDTSAGLSKYGKALKRVSYVFHTTEGCSNNGVPIQVLKASSDTSTSIIDSTKKPIYTSMTKELLASVKYAFDSSSSNNQVKSKKIVEGKKRKKENTSVPILTTTDTVNNKNDGGDDDDDIFKGIGDYQPEGSLTTTSSVCINIPGTSIFDGLLSSENSTNTPNEESTTAKADAFLGKFMNKNDTKTTKSIERGIYDDDAIYGVTASYGGDDNSDEEEVQKSKRHKKA
jgi:hypothetical protein